MCLVTYCYIMFSDPKVIRSYPKTVPLLSQVWRQIAVAFGNPLPACEEEAGDETTRRRDDETRRDLTALLGFVRLCCPWIPMDQSCNFNSISTQLERNLSTLDLLMARMVLLREVKLHKHKQMDAVTYANENYAHEKTTCRHSDFAA